MRADTDFGSLAVFRPFPRAALRETFAARAEAKLELLAPHGRAEGLV